MSQEWNQDSAGDDDVQMPLGTGESSGGSEVAMTDGAARSRFNTSTIALFAAFAAALVVLYLLGLGNKPRSASADQLRLQNDLEEKMSEIIKKNDLNLIDVKLHSTREVLEAFIKQFERIQSVTELPMNPFMTEVRATTVSPTQITTIVPSSDPEVLRKIALEFNGLKLQSVMTNNQKPVAMINNQIVPLRGKIGSFTATAIQTNSVTLSFEDPNYKTPEGEFYKFELKSVDGTRKN